MTHTFQLPQTGNITIEGSEEDLRLFLMMVRGCIADALTYNANYCHFKSWAKALTELYNCMPDPSPYSDPTLDLPF